VTEGAGHGALGPGGEFDRIRAIWRRLGPHARGGGDDCALIEAGGIRLALSVDLAVEGVHFRLGWLQPAEVGWRAAAGALSDLAAVAASPMGVLVSVAVPGDWPDEQVSELMAGVGEAAASVGAVVWGGDLVRHDAVIVDLAVIGRLDGRALLRAGARSGDALWVTGRLGGPLSALRAWSAGREPDATARARFAHPEPRVREAGWLRDRGATSLIDISDGLTADAGQVAAAAGVAIEIDAGHVPIHPAADSVTDALVSGEEYELLVTFPDAAPADLGADFERATGVPLTRIGRVRSGSGVRVVRDGRAIDVPVGFRHF